MNRALNTYLLKLDRWIDAETCARTVDTLKAAPWQPHVYEITGEEEMRSLSGEQELDITYAGDATLKDAIMRKMAMAMQFYAVRLQFSWFDPPRHHSPVRFNRYGPGQLMIEHCDHIASLFDGRDKGVPVLSCVTLLNDDYEGGDFMMWGDEVVPMAAGTTIVFPANFLFPHRVDSVRAGQRYSCVSWGW